MASRYPMPPYPNGWFQIGVSHELAPGQVETLRYFGRELVLYRTESGQALAVDPVCPHLGAHLGLGKVLGEELECRFHRWRFGCDGRPACVPSAQRVPPKARLTQIPLLERNGILFLWHDAEGRPPAFELPDLAEYGHEDWTEYKRLRWNIKSHNQEMAENSVDRAHFRYVHGTLDDDKEDEGYVVELALPWSSLTRAAHVPPRTTDIWRMNFYAMQNNGGAAWSPILGQGNFHKASRFGRVHFSALPSPLP